MPEVLQSTITVEHKGETFEFRVPGPRELSRMGARAHAMRRMDAPETGGSEVGLDPLSRDLYMGMALMETLLVKADAKGDWPFSLGPDGKPTVDSGKFPPLASMILPDVYGGFMRQLDTFLGEGPSDGHAGSEAPVDGKSDPGNTTMGSATPIGA